MSRSCLEKVLPEMLCPFCFQKGAVYFGHGRTYHCTKCVLSWDPYVEVVYSVKAAQDTDNSEYEAVSEAMLSRVKDEMRELSTPWKLRARLDNLQGIPDEIFEAEYDASSEN